MTKSKRIRLVALASSAALGGLTAYYRVQLASYGSEFVFGGISFNAGLLYVAMAVCVAAFLLMTFFINLASADRPSPVGIIYKLFISLSGLCLVGAAVLGLMLSDGGTIELVQCVFAGASGVAILMRAALGEQNTATGLLSLFPVYFLCFFLLRFYRANAGNPSVQSFCIELLTIVMLTLAVYSISSIKFEQPREKWRLFLCLAASYFVVVEALSYLLMPPLLLTVPGINLGALAVIFSLGLYVCAGLFAPGELAAQKRAASDAPPVVEGGDEPIITVGKIIADEITARATDEACETDTENPED